MIKIIKNLGIFIAIITALKVFGLLINALPIWNWLTQFFVFIKKMVSPVDFIWNFDTTSQIIVVILGILIAYSIVQGYIIIRDNFKN